MCLSKILESNKNSASLKKIRKLKRFSWCSLWKYYQYCYFPSREFWWVWGIFALRCFSNQQMWTLLKILQLAVETFQKHHLLRMEKSCAASPALVPHNFNSIPEGLPWLWQHPLPAQPLPVRPEPAQLNPGTPQPAVQRQAPGTSLLSVRPGYKRATGVGRLASLGDVQKKTSMADWKRLRHVANISLAAFPAFGLRVCARLLLCRKKLSPQRGPSLVKLLGASTATLRLPARSGEKASAWCFFAIRCYVLGLLSYVNILEWEGERSAHMRESWTSEQGSLDFSPSTRLMSGFFFPSFSLFPTDVRCFQ